MAIAAGKPDTLLRMHAAPAIAPPFAPIEEILDELRRGRAIVLVDDESRENEGDLVCAAESVTPEMINFMVQHTPGYLCIAMTEADCERLELHAQTPANTSLRATPMAVSIDGHTRHGVGTGISASDRAITTRLAAAADTRPDDLVRPGHMVPLRARDGGVLVRTGQTEGSVDLMKLAGLRPAAVISEVSRADGEMARLPELAELCTEHDLKMCSVEQIIAHRLAQETLIKRLSPERGTMIDTPHGQFNLIAYQSTIDPLPHLALTVGGVGDLDDAGHVVETDEPTLVRVHRRDLLGDIFDEATRPSGRDLRAALQRIQDERRGALVYLRPEGSGDDLRDRLLRIQRPTDDDVNAPDLTRADGVGAKVHPMHYRENGIGSQILRDLGLHRLRVLTNHPKTHPGVSAYGLEIIEQLPIGD